MELATQPASLPLTRGGAISHALLRLALGATMTEVAAGKVLCREGEERSVLFVVLSGAIAVSYSASCGKRATVSILGPEDLVGHQALIRPGLRSGTAQPLPEIRALIESRVMVIPSEGLEAAMRRRPEIAAWIASCLARQLSRADERLGMTLTSGVAGRILGALAGLAQTHGQPGDSGWVDIDLSLSQDLLATLVGASRESVNRAVRELRTREEIRHGGLRYSVRDQVAEVGGSS